MQPRQQISSASGYPVDRYPGMETYLNVCADILERWTQQGEKHEEKNSTTANFAGAFECYFPLKDYFNRISTYAGCTNEVFTILMVYIDRLTFPEGDRFPALVLNRFNVHRVITVCLLAACKYQDDKYYLNAHFAEMCGLPLEELNLLEGYFYSLIGFNTDVSAAEFSALYNTVRNRAFELNFVDPNLSPYSLVDSAPREYRQPKYRLDQDKRYKLKEDDLLVQIVPLARPVLSMKKTVYREQSLNPNAPSFYPVEQRVQVEQPCFAGSDGRRTVFQRYQVDRNYF
eukprot:maker-scaffold_47-snap-gene-0.53-mRNA-1 protein AED:0.38 eAED:0.38 QI:254/1/1/1/1/1/2/262/285